MHGGFNSLYKCVNNNQQITLIRQDCYKFRITKKLMSQQGLITLAISYSTATYVILPITTIYAGLFLTISNHYVLRPKIQAFLEKASISSALASELIIDVLSNLSFISYAISAFFMTKVTDYPFRLLEYYNMYWLTLCLAVVMYMKIPIEEPISTIIISKNGFFLALCYADILYHYFAGSTLISFPAILLGLYLINMGINAHQDKFIQFVYELLGIKMPPVERPKPKIISKRPTIEFLSKNYPVTREQLNAKLEILDRDKVSKNSFKNTRNRKQFSSQINTKIVAKERLMQICACLHLSLAKKQDEEINNVRQYFIFMNGTISQKISEANKAKLGFRQRITYYNQKNKRKTAKLTKLQLQKSKEDQIAEKKKQSKKENKKQESKELEFQNTGSNLVQKGLFEREEELNFEGSNEEQSFIFYIFPVKIFESSKVISTTFSIMINLGFGILLNYCQNVMNTLAYGQYSQFILALLLLPVIPHASALEYANTMALTSIWKYGICGLFATLSIATNSNQSMSGRWKQTQYFQYQTIVQLIVLIASFTLLFTGKNKFKLLLILTLLAIGGNAGITYLSVIH